jgi:hypothetical protein
MKLKFEVEGILCPVLVKLLKPNERTLIHWTERGLKESK